MFSKKRFSKNLANFTGKHQCWSLFLIKLQQIRPATLLKLDSNRFFPVKFVKFFKNTYFEEHLSTDTSIKKGSKKLTLSWVRKTNPI